MSTTAAQANRTVEQRAPGAGGGRPGEEVGCAEAHAQRPALRAWGDASWHARVCMHTHARTSRPSPPHSLAAAARGAPAAAPVPSTPASPRCPKGPAQRQEARRGAGGGGGGGGQQ